MAAVTVGLPASHGGRAADGLSRGGGPLDGGAAGGGAPRLRVVGVPTGGDGHFQVGQLGVQGMQVCRGVGGQRRLGLGGRR